jgi:hypothetical protein
MPAPAIYFPAVARVAAAVVATSALAAPPASAQSLEQLLLSSPWCSSSYNQITGTSRSKRYLFRRDGSYSTGSGAESHNSGPSGSVGSQSRGNGGGRWGVQNNVLFMGEGYGQAQPVNLRVNRNSNGYPIIVADGIEYRMCP